MKIEAIYITVIALILIYLIGSFPTTYVVGRIRKGIDIREVGSWNMGAMNVFYQVGIVQGLLFFVLPRGRVKGSMMRYG